MSTNGNKKYIFVCIQKHAAFDKMCYNYIYAYESSFDLKNMKIFVSYIKQKLCESINPPKTVILMRILS